MFLLTFPPSFLVFALAQTISVAGSEMTRFAIPIWIFSSGGGAVGVSLATAAGFLPQVLLGPIAGRAIERFGLRKLLVFADILLAGLSLLLVAIASYPLTFSRMGLIYAVMATAGAVSAFQTPSLQIVTSVMTSEDALSRANGLVSFGESLGGVFAPAMAAAILLWLGIRGVILVDMVSFILSATLTATLRVPALDAPLHAKERRGPLFGDIVEGLAMIRQTRVLPLALAFSCAINFFVSFGYVLVIPLLLSLPGGSKEVIAIVFGVMAASRLIGSSIATVLTVQDHMAILTFGTALLGSALLTVGLAGEIVLIALGLAIIGCALPIINAHNRALWQKRVPLKSQGRLFGLRRSISLLFAPLGYALAGPVSDWVVAPCLRLPMPQAYGLSISAAGALTASFAMGAWFVTRRKAP